MTPEFWATLITNVVGLGVLFGGLTSEQGNNVTEQLKIISGAIISLTSTLTYVKTRVDLKREIVQATMYRMLSDNADDKVSTLSTAGVGDVLKSLGI
jgi:hypothetical protein